MNFRLNYAQLKARHNIPRTKLRIDHEVHFTSIVAASSYNSAGETDVVWVEN